jgi:predicted dehydrogenase
MSGLEIGLVGVGPWGSHILRDLRALGANVHAVARSTQSIERAVQGGASSIVDHPRKLPNSCSGFVIANRTISHIDAIEDLLPRQQPIYVEKPLGLDLGRMARIADIASDLVFTMHKWRYHPGIQELERIATSGCFGKVLGLRSFRLGWRNPHEDVNSLWILAPHELSIALHILGEVPILKDAWSEPLSTNGDGAIAFLQTRLGIPVCFEVSSSHSVPLRRVILSCSEATCVLDQNNYAAIDIAFTQSSQRDTVSVSTEFPLLRELRTFIEFLRGGPSPYTSFKDEMQICRTIDQIATVISR